MRREPNAVCVPPLMIRMNPYDFIEEAPAVELRREEETVEVSAEPSP